MATTDLDAETAMTALESLDQLIERQRARVLAIARRLCPDLPDDALRDAHALRDLQGDATFAHEAGQLAGLRAARMALQARLLDRTVAQG